MSNVTKRKYPRYADCAPILYVGYSFNSYSEAMMYNSCFRDFRARVKWCRQVTEGKNPRFGIGVHISARSHLSYGLNLENSDYICDFCENKATNGLIHRTQSWLFLCSDCLHYMEALPGNQEKALEQFLLGNVV